VYFIHTDHLNTPRVVVDRQNRVRWRWLAEPFGTSAPETNPSGLGVFTQNLRFPGQYADAESGLFYNYHRYYAAAGGGYTQSDPIGLAGGSVSTFGYVGGNPLSYTDPQGLCLPCVFVWIAETLGVSVETVVVGSVIGTEIGVGLATGAVSPGSSVGAVGNTVRTAEQYSLRVLKDGFYPVMKRGYKDPVAVTWCEAGDVWKFGKTINPSTRYSQAALKNIGEHGVEYKNEFTSLSNEALLLELMKIENYVQQVGKLPPGNKIKR
jgi:RHS repeat-associated protein